MKNDNVETHESYGMLQISRVQCTPPMNVFGSSVKTGNPICLRISRAEKGRDLSRTWFHSREQLIEIYMSPAQFADAITSLNNGPGTPVTLTRIGKEGVESCPEIDQRQIFHDEFKKKIEMICKELTNLKASADRLLSTKAVMKGPEKKELLVRIGLVEQDIRANIPFTFEQFNEAMNKTTSEAKAEVEAFVTNSIISAGLESMACKMPEIFSSREPVLELEASQSREPIIKD